MPFTNSLPPPSVATEFGMAVSWGLVKGYTRVAGFGFVADVDGGTLPEDVWTNGGSYPWMSAATALELVSTSVNDVAVTGTGVRTVLVSGLDAAYIPVTMTISMNGTTPVPLPTPLFRVNSMISTGAGSSGLNAGVINLRDVSGGTVRATIAAGIGITQQSPYTVPAGFTLQIVSIYSSITGTGSTRTADISTFFRGATGASRLPLTLTTSDGKPYRHDAIPGIMASEKTDFSLRVTSVSNDNSQIISAWLGILRQNT